MDFAITFFAVIFLLVAALSLGMAIGEAVQDYTYNYYKQIGENIMSINRDKNKAEWGIEGGLIPAFILPTIGIARDKFGGSGRVEWSLVVILPFFAFAITRTK